MICERLLKLARTLLVEPVADPQFIDLAWRIFFQEKLRGIEIEAHFPWIKKSKPNIWYVTLREDDKVIGGALVKELKFSTLNFNFIIGVVGLICIDPEFRGCGLAKEMLALLITESRSKHYDALTLWSSKHKVYSPHGFSVNDRTFYGAVDMLAYERHGQQKLKFQHYNLPKHLGLPPFAVRGECYSNDMADIRVVYDNYGPILVDWNGDIQYALCLIESVLPMNFRMNTYTNDKLPCMLEKYSGKLTLTKSNLQMWNILHNKYEASHIIDNAHFSILDRI